MTSQMLRRLILKKVEYLFGEFGAGKVISRIAVKYWSPATSTGIVRVAREYFRLVWAALTFMDHLPAPVDKKCVCIVVHVSGTMKKVQLEAIKRAKRLIRTVGGEAAKYAKEDVVMEDDTDENEDEG
ncbi:hypothetical protein K470DRAFT_256575 [Piedraia hortae CBS 480.64]|uniref:Uncharacterized protein n=1 Tax=Piedraia hortae CBS 480.64 TaxID=1314780 RepID=A0A6A7C2J1_9PEZI|nr:hypothetical protein K470DRAFT_256575 [Piedraia hortae CBS 480.64]